MIPTKVHIYIVKPSPLPLILEKNTPKAYFFTKMFGGKEKSPYLCNRLKETSTLLQ